MDRESIKEMAHALLAYSKSRSLLKMTEKELADLPKEVLIGLASQEIALVWDKLPQRLKDDPEVLKYQFCEDHHHEKCDNQPDGVDVNDGPIPRKVFCCFCRMKM